MTVLEHCKNPKSNNKSGYTGVYREKDGKWRAYINFKKKRYWLGSYDDIADAVRARKRGEEMHDSFLEWYYTEVERKTHRKRA